MYKSSNAVAAGMYRYPFIALLFLALLFLLFMCEQLDLRPAQGLTQEKPPKDSLSQADELAFLTQQSWLQMRRAPTATKSLEKVLTLEDCLKIAKENSGKLILGMDRLKAAKLAYWQKKRNILPPLGFKFNIKEGLLNTGNQQTYRGMGGQLISDFAVYDTEAKFKELGKARLAYIRAREERKKTQNELGFTVRQAYYQLAQITLLRDLQKRLQTKVEGIAKRAEKMAAKKLLKPTDLAATRLQIQETRQQTATIEEQYLLQQLVMKQLLNVYPSAPLQIKTDLRYMEPPVHIDPCLRLAYQKRPEMIRSALQEETMKLDRDIQYASNKLRVSINTAVGLRAEDFTGAPEGLQTRIDANMGIKVSLPIGPHVLRYEPNFVKEVKDVGQTTPTDYNEHSAILDFYKGSVKRANLEADVAHEEALSDTEALRKEFAMEVGNALLALEQARTQVGSAKFNYGLAQQRLKVILAQAQKEVGVSINDEMMGYVTTSEAAKSVVSSRYALFQQFNRLNQTLGVDGYWDPHSGKENDALLAPAPSEAGDKRWYELWHDPLFDEDQKLLAVPLYEDYLLPPAVQLTWDEFVRSKQTYPLLHFVPAYPKVSLHGEYRSRFHWSKETQDLGMNIQPIVQNVTTNTALGATELPVTIDPKDVTLAKPYLQVDDNYVSWQQRFLGTFQGDVTRNFSIFVTMEVDNLNLGGYKAPREMTLMPFQDQDFETTLVEAYFKIIDTFGIDGLNVRIGRQFLDFELGFFFNDVQKEENLDLAQIVYTQNPWQFSFFYLHPVFNNVHEHFLANDVPDAQGAYARYKSDTWRYTSAFVSTTRGTQLGAPLTFLNQLQWDPFPFLETDSSVIYQFGKLIEKPGQSLSSWGMDFSLKYKTDWPGHPQFGCKFMVLQGSHQGDKKTLDLLLNTGDYGYIVEPLLKNLYILHAFASFQITKHSSLTLKHYYFAQYRSRRDALADPRLDNSGIWVPPNGYNRNIGHEFDAVHEIEWMDNLSTQMVVAWFLPGHAYGNNPDSQFPGTGWRKIPFEFRWQILFNF